MEITIKQLSPELISDYFDFFDNRAFTDNPPWAGCYCVGWQYTKAEEKAQFYDRLEENGGQENFMRVLREIVARQIESRALRGYLAYVDGVAIGWCNANDRANFPEESATGARLYAPADRRERAVVCFEIAPGFRGKGIATALLSKVLEDARLDGCAAVVGFPVVHGERNEWDYTGPVRLYEKAGFIRGEDESGAMVMKKELAGL